MRKKHNEHGPALSGHDGFQAAAAGARPGERPDRTDWAFLPEGLRDMGQNFTDPDSFWAEVATLIAMANERKTLKDATPDSLMTDEDWQMFWRAAGRPDKPEGYKLPEQWADERFAPEALETVNRILTEERPILLQAFHKGNLTVRQAEALYSIICDLMTQNIQSEFDSQRDWPSVIEELWPGNSDRQLDLARRGARYAGLAKALDDAGLSVNPLVLRLAHALGELVGEAGMPGSSGSAPALPRGEAAREEMYSLIASPAYRANEPSAIRKVEALAGRIDV